jgi:hypothetical protein
MEKLSNAWIFVSHSHLDVEAVRRIRNEFERLDANPILFFLKAMTEENREELDVLIKREIAARNFFVLCDSKNARESDWVRREQDYVLSLPHRSVHRIDLASPWETQQQVISETIRATTVFASYLRADLDRVLPYLKYLQQNDFSVCEYRSIPALLPWEQQIGDVIEGVTGDNGRFIAFLSNRALGSPYVRKEIELFFERSRASGSSLSAILALLEPFPSPPPFEGIVVDLSNGGVDESGPALLRALGV